MCLKCINVKLNLHLKVTYTVSLYSIMGVSKLQNLLVITDNYDVVLRIER